ncbi:MAG: DUF6577 family protein [Candidatus Hydrothermarchaeales archaeon]
MGWLKYALETIHETFGDSSFSSSDAIEVFRKKKFYSDGTVYRLLHDLVDIGALEKIGTGIYRFSGQYVETAPKTETREAVRGELSTDMLRRAKELLEETGVEFMITGPSTLVRYHHHFPKRLVHLIYVVKGAGDPAFGLLRDKGIKTLLNPRESEIRLALESLVERDLVVLREYSELMGNIDGVASLERALVDTYFEGTRGRMPYPKTEIGRIVVAVLRSGKVNITRLFTLASRRGVEGEMRAIVKEVMPRIHIGRGKKNKHVRDVLSVLESR